MERVHRHCPLIALVQDEDAGVGRRLDGGHRTATRHVGLPHEEIKMKLFFGGNHNGWLRFLCHSGGCGQDPGEEANRTSSIHFSSYVNQRSLARPFIIQPAMCMRSMRIMSGL